MIDQGLRTFSGKRVLLLQGPVGPFFARLARDLRAVDAQVFKVNFNAGDWFFYRRDAMNYRGTMEAWPAWFEAQLRRLDIDVVFLFGDCRPVHQAAHRVATALGVEVGVFEEGYVRPDYITLERSGVNGYSRLPRVAQAYNAPLASQPEALPVGNSYWSMVRCGFCYFTIGSLGRPFFPNYVHHRPLNILEAFPWLRSVWRKQWYRRAERGAQEQLTGEFKGRYFLVPLQVFNDAQIRVHAPFAGVEEFIENTIRSFAARAPDDTLLVFKHHPMDRGYRDYGRLIRKLARELQLSHRLQYIHDQHLPTLLDHARGVVVVNSTVGLSALFHSAPTKVCGRALYDMSGLTYQGSLDDFWSDAPRHKPDEALYRRFRSHLVAATQLNGSFYRPLQGLQSATGVVWDARLAHREPPKTVPVWRVQPIQTVPTIRTREGHPAPAATSWAAPLAQALEDAERALPVFYEQERMDVRA
jgi:capsular polysaccharide export protein